MWIAVVDKVGEYDRQTQTDRMVIVSRDCRHLSVTVFLVVCAYVRVRLSVYLSVSHVLV